ncbi:MAG: peptidylprolyl isomerase [Bacteroidia bacterium]|nr:peptidylprolyl isomerase [Bacteroidia bacterium]NND51808.1 hypothetical protein [Flavobacteriaceae bacterium]
MFRITFLCFAILISISSNAQEDFKVDLDSVTTFEKAKKYLETFDNRQNKIITFNEEKHKTRFAKEIFKLSNGGTKVVENEIENVHYKVIEKNDVIYYRVHYIFLDGDKMSMRDIDILRPKLVKQIERGVPFKDLAIQYSMDTNRKRGGDSGWITHGDMLPEFEEHVLNDDHKLDDIFLVNVESNKWYFVVKKTYDKKKIQEVKVLRVVEPKR